MYTKNDYDQIKLQKIIKRAKIFTIQRLTRRMKMLKNKRGTEQQRAKNQRKITRLEEEMERIKDINSEKVSEIITSRMSLDQSELSTYNLEEQALWKLISSNPIQDYLNSSSKPALIPQFKDVSSTKRLQDNLDKSSPEISEDSESNCHKNVSCHYQGVINELNDKNFSNGYVNQSDSKLKCSDNQSKLSDIDMSIIDENIGQSKVQSMHTSFFVHNLSSAKGNENKKVQQQNRFMDQSKKNKFNLKKKQARVSTNRMGQRARQKLWRQQYGSKAKHVKKFTKKTRIEPNSKKENEKPRQKFTAAKRKEVKNDLSTNHPSWEASKRRKLQNNISEVKFQGQKITFVDSD